jgi:hypothetical protein
MAKPLSMDLRERVIAAVEKDGLSVAACGGGPVRHRGEHDVRLAAALPGDGKRGTGPMGGHKPKAIRASTRPGCGSGYGSETSPCAALWTSSRHAGSRPTNTRSGSSCMPRR